MLTNCFFLSFVSFCRLDGKFILELARAREGDKTGWISVPRKSFWPATVQSSTSANFKKHESSASLSCKRSKHFYKKLEFLSKKTFFPPHTDSDDNSSIQSSPWQRDHCWKQTSPQHNISKEMSLYFCRPATISPTAETAKFGFQKRRRPYDRAESKWTFREEQVQSNGERSHQKKNGEREGEDCVDGVKMETPEQNGGGAATRQKKPHKRLSLVVKRLMDRIQSGIAITSRLNHLVQSSPASGGQGGGGPQHLSPRKRILERASLDDATSKRSRAKQQQLHVGGGANSHGPKIATGPPSSASPLLTANLYASSSVNLIRNGDTHTVSAAGTSSIPVATLPTVNQTAASSAAPAAAAAATTTTTPQRISSYSITSLLGHNSSETKKNSTSDTSHQRSPPSPTISESRFVHTLFSLLSMTCYKAFVVYLSKTSNNFDNFRFSNFNQTSKK